MYQLCNVSAMKMFGIFLELERKLKFDNIRLHHIYISQLQKLYCVVHTANNR